MSEVHPLIQLVSFYHENWEEKEDTSPLSFQQQYGLSIDVPIGWPYVEAVHTLIELALQQTGPIVVIYPTTKIYNEIALTADETTGYNVGSSPSVKYLSWHEIYVAMDVAPKDRRDLSRISEILSGAVLTIFIGAPYGFPEVANQVRMMCLGRLVILRTSEEKEI